MTPMELVALQGLLDDKSLVQLSTAASHTVTRSARHGAMKRQMLLRRVWRKDWLREIASQDEHDSRMKLQKLANIITSPPMFAKMSAMDMMDDILGRRVTPAEVRVFSAAHDLQELENEEPLTEGESVEEEEPVEEEGRVFASV
jgi:hypothetical protein